MKDNQWYIITYLDAVFLENPAFIDFGSMFVAGGEAHQEFFVVALGVILIPGNYRLVKTFLSKEEPMHEQSVAVPFTGEGTKRMGLVPVYCYDNDRSANECTFLLLV